MWKEHIKWSIGSSMIIRGPRSLILRSSADSAIASERLVTLLGVMPIAFDHSCCELVIPQGPPFQERPQLAAA